MELHFAEAGVTILHLDIDALLWLWLEQMGKPGLTRVASTDTAGTKAAAISLLYHIKYWNILRQIKI